MISRDTDVHDCPYCEGKGWVFVDGVGENWVCWDCDGRGEVCNLCGAPWRSGHSCEMDSEDVKPQEFWGGF